MAKKKLLRRLAPLLLVVGLTMLQGNRVYAAAKNTLGETLAGQARELVWQDLAKSLKANKIYGEDLAGNLGLNDGGGGISSGGKAYEIKVFVSSSMPKELLKAYAKEAKLFGGILVFKGLPSGSFKELQKQVMSLGTIGPSGEEDLPAMQIDQEEFEYFGVNRVPVVVLQKQQNCFDEQSCPRVFDKVTGNIGIRAALEQFRDKGDLASLAGEVLGEALGGVLGEVIKPEQGNLFKKQWRVLVSWLS